MTHHSSNKPFRSSGGTVVARTASVADTSFVLQAHSEGNVPALFQPRMQGGSTHDHQSSTIQQHGFSPYDFNGGTVAAVAGPDYCVVAADTRLSSGYEILSRKGTKLHALTETAVLASSGCKTDVDQLRSWLDIKQKVCDCLCVCVCVLLNKKTLLYYCCLGLG